jgi:hypothetical protein
VLLFVAADVIIRWLYRVKLPSERSTLTLAPAAALAAAEIPLVVPAGVEPAATYPKTSPADLPDEPAFTGNKEGDETRPAGPPEVSGGKEERP